jgi:hypothetical protein
MRTIGLFSRWKGCRRMPSGRRRASQAARRIFASAGSQASATSCYFHRNERRFVRGRSGSSVRAQVERRVVNQDVHIVKNQCHPTLSSSYKSTHDSFINTTRHADINPLITPTTHIRNHVGCSILYEDSRVIARNKRIHS